MKLETMGYEIARTSSKKETCIDGQDIVIGKNLANKRFDV